MKATDPLGQIIRSSEFLASLPPMSLQFEMTMTPGIWISLFGIVAAAVVSLVIAYMARKQARQIELHRIDPKKFPLKPPPHFLTVLVKTYWDVLVGLVYEVVLLIVLMRSNAPITKSMLLEFAIITLGIVMMLLLAFTKIVSAVFFEIKQTQSRVIKILAMQADILAEIHVRFSKEKSENAPTEK